MPCPECAAWTALERAARGCSTCPLTGRVPKPKAEQPRPPRLAADIVDARATLPPEQLVDALQDRPYPASGSLVAGKEVALPKIATPKAEQPSAELVAAELRAEAAFILEQEGWLVGRYARDIHSMRLTIFFERFSSWLEKVKAFRVANPNAWPEPPDNS
jgi:hypothetical protein